MLLLPERSLGQLWQSGTWVAALWMGDPHPFTFCRHSITAWLFPRSKRKLCCKYDFLAGKMSSSSSGSLKGCLCHPVSHLLPPRNGPNGVKAWLLLQQARKVAKWKWVLWENVRKYCLCWRVGHRQSFPVRIANSEQSGFSDKTRLN